MLPWAAWLCRKARLGGLLVEVRNGTTLGIVAPLHFQVVHTMQQLSAIMTARLPNSEDAATQVAIRVCNECRMLMGLALELNAHDLHCCLNVMILEELPESQTGWQPGLDLNHLTTGQ